MTDLSYRNTENTSDVIRELGPLEQLFWLCDQNQPFHFATSIGGERGATPRFNRVNALRSWLIIPSRMGCRSPT
jgi:hypothetical protein